MLPTYRIDGAGGIVSLRWGDARATTTAFRALLEAVFADPAFRVGMHFLSDRRAVPQVPDPDFTRYFLRYLRENADRFGRCRWATVVSTDTMHGMIRMTEIIGETSHVQFRGFRELAAAEAWLRKPPAD